MKHTHILASLSSDHSAILVSLMKSVVPQGGRGLWKFNCSLLHNAKFIEEMTNHITVFFKKMFDEENIRNENIRWELLKYEMKNFSKTFSKQISLESNKERKLLEKRVKDFERSI